MSQLGFCDTENCKRCYKKYGCQQYLIYLENIATSSTEVSGATMGVFSLDVNKIALDIEKLKLSNEVIGEKLDYLVGIFQHVEVASNLDGIQIRAQGNFSIEDSSDVGMIVYNDDVGSEKTLVQKKGLLGLGKAKWVEEK